MTYTYCKKIIENGLRNETLDVEDMMQKLDVFWLNNRITEAQYNELMAMFDITE